MWSKGICWIDDCRIPFVDENDIKSQERAFSPNSSSHKGQVWNNHLGWEGPTGPAEPTDIRGRFPANILVCDDMLNDGSIGKGQKNPRVQKTTRRYGENNFTNGGLFTSEGNITATYNDKGTNSRYYDIDKWFEKILNYE